MCDPTTTSKPKIKKKRYVELRKLSEELYDWLKLHKIEVDEVCVLKELTYELLNLE